MKKVFGILAVVLFSSSSLSASVVMQSTDCWAVAEAAEAACSGGAQNHVVFAAAFDACWSQQ
ncbi:hypothetical protein JM658_13405 [Joostella atrarenae]|uniref:Uncharacterized protein n=1 Tax=Joostella atrarenae TaxID=679257 RepID=A0ABS9J5X8_9FLAO|nr:hypothetical protein [Joostella atrarenae]MCF8715827.1 hypothetical protein [Joostella atrarenae]